MHPEKKPGILLCGKVAEVFEEDGARIIKVSISGACITIHPDPGEEFELGDEITIDAPLRIRRLESRCRSDSAWEE